MNLNIAAQFLDESIYLTEDADSKGRDQTIKWVKNNFNLEQLGYSATENALDDNDNEVTFARPGIRGRVPGPNAEYIFRRAESFFAHPLNQGVDRRKGINAYLPGATRIAITECGWLTRNVNAKMMENLRYVYAALFFDYYDKRGPYHTDEQGHLVAEHPGYAGLCNYDFDGRTYDELMADFGAMIPEAKQRLQDQLAGAEMETAEGQQAAGPAERHAGAYHIEFIPTFDESKKWYKYTNPQCEDAGCHWCITQSSGYWHDYKDKHGGTETVYFCWKAESKEALLAMNDHFHDYCRSDAPSAEIDNAPLNEYGLSLICIMIHPGPDGKAIFDNATSRYNHYGPDGRWHDGLYGDWLVRQGDTAAICRILGISEDEFPDLFPFKTSGNVDHTSLVRDLAAAKAEGNLNRVLSLAGIDPDAFEANEKLVSADNNMIAFRHSGEYNLLTLDGTLVSPSVWFAKVKQIAKNVAAVKRADNTKVNFITGNGKFLLPRDVYNYKVIEGERYSNYAAIEVRRGLWNILNINTGAILLRKPVAEVMLSNKYGKGIFVKKTPETAWEQIDIKGKTIFKLANANPGTKPLANINNFAAIQDYKNYISIINTSNSRTVWKKKFKDPMVYVKNNCFLVVDKDNNELNILSGTGELLKTFNENDGYRVITQSSTSSLDKLKSYDACDGYIPLLSNEHGMDFFDIENKEIFNIDPQEILEGAITYPIIFNKNIKILKDSDNRIYEIVGDECGYMDDADDDTVVTGVINTLNKNKQIYLVTTQSRKCGIYNADTQEFLSPLFGTNGYNFNVGILDNDTYILFVNNDERKTYLYDSDGELINTDTFDKGSIDTVKSLFYAGQGCFVLGDEHEKHNIINIDGKFMFKNPFTEFVSMGFSNEGIASIKAGRNTYFINTDGDVSRNLESLNESFRNNEDLPMINESEEPKPKVKSTKLDLAAYLMD